MFYCDECRVKHRLPESPGFLFMASMGPCEYCKKTRACHDVPSSSLPDAQPQRKNTNMNDAMETTFALIKPDAVAAGHAGEILSIMERSFLVGDVLATTWTLDQVKRFYAKHAERPYFNDLVAFMSSGPMYAVTLTAPGAVKKWREIIGETDPKMASPGSIRGRFGDKQGPIMRNAVHGSDSVAAAREEIGFICSVGLSDEFGLVQYQYLQQSDPLPREPWSETRSSESRKVIVCVDFDGVLHSYTSGWQGAAVAADPPVPGAMAWLVQMSEEPRFEIHIYSSRSKEPKGIMTMMEWLTVWLAKHAMEGNYGELDAMEWAVRVVNRLKFSSEKPAASMTIDDRALCFEGTFPTKEWILGFKPWNKR